MDRELATVVTLVSSPASLIIIIASSRRLRGLLQLLDELFRQGCETNCLSCAARRVAIASGGNCCLVRGFRADGFQSDFRARWRLRLYTPAPGGISERTGARGWRLTHRLILRKEVEIATVAIAHGCTRPILPGRAGECEQRSCFRAFWLAMILPASVRGPVEGER